MDLALICSASLAALSGGLLAWSVNYDGLGAPPPAPQAVHTVQGEIAVGAVGRRRNLAVNGYLSALGSLEACARGFLANQPKKRDSRDGRVSFGNSSGIVRLTLLAVSCRSRTSLSASNQLLMALAP